MDDVIIDSMCSSRRPWLHVCSGEAELAVVEAKVRERGGRSFYFDGAEMRDVDSLFDSYARQFMFPEYFGANWPAFKECMTHLSGLPAPAYLTVIRQGGLVLSSEPADLPTYLRIIDDVGKSWSRRLGLGPEWGGGEVAFNTVLLCEELDVERLREAWGR